MRPSDHSEPPRDQPIAMLATIAKLIDESLAAALEHYATPFQAQPHVLDDSDSLAHRARLRRGS
jgi:hypothetical protein